MNVLIYKMGPDETRAIMFRRVPPSSPTPDHRHPLNELNEFLLNELIYYLIYFCNTCFKHLFIISTLNCLFVLFIYLLINFKNCHGTFCGMT